MFLKIPTSWPKIWVGNTENLQLYQSSLGTSLLDEPEIL